MNNGNKIEIQAIQVPDHYDTVWAMMKELHDSERDFFQRSALWQDIHTNYMRHVIEMQKENDGTFLVAYSDAKPLGFIFAYVEEEGDERIDDYSGKQLYVSDGFVYPEYRRQGIYRLINEKLEEIYLNKGIRRILRFTLANNIRMQHFLEQQGYATTRLLYEKWLDQDGLGKPLNLPAAE